MMKFHSKVVWVTGAGQGIGFEICRQFALEGANVALNDIDSSLAEAAAGKINREAGREAVIPLPGDISNYVELESAGVKIISSFGRLDILVANAGLTSFGAFLEYSPEAFNRVVEINLRGSFFSAQIAAKQMISQKTQGRILLMSSVTGVQAHRNLSAYGMTKAAIRMLARSLALELGPYGITVNALGPGATLTERTLQEGESFIAGWKSVAPDNQVASVADIAAAALFLASDEARHITGETLMIDGGWTIHSPLPGDQYEG